MIQHQIPQNVTKYEFGLIGGVTPRQFIEAASGIVVGLIIQYLFVFIPSYIRTPIAIGIALMGVAFTFLKYEERTLDTWFINFLKSIYSPTEYIWKRNLVLPSFFTFTSVSKKSTPTLSPQKIYHSPEPATIPFMDSPPLSEEQEKNLNQIHQLFNSPAQLPASPLIPISSDPKIAVITTPIQISQPIDSSLSTSINSPSFSTNPPTFPPNPLPTAPISNPVIDPPKSAPQAQKPQLIHKAPSLAPALKIRSIYKDKNPKSVLPEFASDIDIPITNESPNIVTGITLDDRERLISNVVVEITDENNLPVRAVKSNKLSQFFIASPLKNGNYQIKAQHPDYVFDKIDIKASGQIIPPIKIIGKAK